MFYQDIRISAKTATQMTKVLDRIEQLLKEDEDIFDFEYGEDYDED